MHSTNITHFIRKGSAKMPMAPRIDPEFKQLIPPLSNEEYQQLEQNILAHRKCRDAVILWNGLIIDGHSRFYICVKHGIQFEFKEISFSSREDAKLWIVENQLGRRNLTDAMRIELALCKVDMLREKAKANQSRAGGDKTRAGALFPKPSKAVDEPINVEEVIAKEAGIGKGTLYRYMRIKEDGGPGLLEKVKIGEIKIGSAYLMLAKEIEKRLKQADKWYAYIAERMPFEDNEEGTRMIYKHLEDLAGQLRALLKKLDRLNEVKLCEAKGDAHDDKN